VLRAQLTAQMAGGKAGGKGSGGVTRKGSGKGSASSLCVCCGNTEHLKKECFHAKKTCNTCGKIGHLSHVCKASPVAPTNEPKSRVPGAQRSYAEVAKQQDMWLCHSCNRFVMDGRNACQGVGCHAKRPAPTAVVQPSASTALSKSFLKDCPATDAEELNSLTDDAAWNAEISRMLGLIEYLKANGGAKELPAAQESLRLLEESKPTAKTPDLKSQAKCSTEHFRLRALMEKGVLANEAEEEKEKDILLVFQAHLKSTLEQIDQKYARDREVALQGEKDHAARRASVTLERQKQFIAKQELLKVGLEEVAVRQAAMGGPAPTQEPPAEEASVEEQAAPPRSQEDKTKSEALKLPGKARNELLMELMARQAQDDAEEERRMELEKEKKDGDQDMTPDEAKRKLENDERNATQPDKKSKK
jgi:hypothetical protein